jgi:hypothetical protein
MSATATAIRVLDWAAGGSGPPPIGDLKDPPGLLGPAPGLARAMGRLCALTCARLRWGAPPLGDERPLQLGSALLAAALGAAPQDQGDAVSLLDAVLPAVTPADWALRHGLVGTALPFLPTVLPSALADVQTADSRSAPHDDQGNARPDSGRARPPRPARVPIADDWLRLSPLTALLQAPPEDRRPALTYLAAELIACPAGRRWLVLALSEPSDDPAVRLWRRELLGRLLTGDPQTGPEFVLDCYEATAVHHGQVALAQVRHARAVLTARFGRPDDLGLKDALSVAAWWRPLWELRRARPDELRRRPYLGYAYLEALDLCGLAGQLTGDAQ